MLKVIWVLLFGNFRQKILQQKILAVKRGIIELEASIAHHQGLLDYERESLSQKQIEQYELAIKSAQEQIKTNEDFIRYVEPLI